MDTRKRTLTKTHVLYVYETCSEDEKERVCNIECIHCYYRFDSQKFRKLSDLKKEINWVVKKGADHIQINGAEPTLHPEFIELIKYIHEKKLLCSVITNGHILSDYEFAKRTKPYTKYYLFSVHGGTEDIVNQVTQNNKSWNLIKNALDNLESLDIEVQINFTVMKNNYKTAEDLIEVLKNKKNITRFNFICFNPFHSWETEKGKNKITNLIASYDEVMPSLEKACKKAVDSGFDVALRYFPFCKVPEWLRPYTFNFVTSIFDRNEWRREWMLPEAFEKNRPILKKVADNLSLEGTEEQKLEHAFGRYFKGFRKFFYNHESCENCSNNLICDHPHKEQVQSFPKQEYDTIEGELIRDGMHYFSKKKKLPFVSVIIPTYNNKNVLKKTIEKVLLQDYPKEKFEIIIVDDGSSDGTKNLIKDFILQNPKIKYFFQEDKGFRVGQARNLGAKNAKGKYLVFLNQDVKPKKDMVSNYVSELMFCDAVIGYTSGYSLINGLFQYKDSRHDIFNDDSFNDSKVNSEIWKFFYGSTFAVRKDIFKKNYFDEGFIGWGIEDEEFGYRLIKTKKRVKLRKNCIGYHIHENHHHLDRKRWNEYFKNIDFFYNKYKDPEIILHYYYAIKYNIKTIDNDDPLFNSFKQKYKNIIKYNQKLVSVIIPTYNNSERIRLAVKSIANQSFNQNLIEVIIADDGSTENIKKISEELAKETRLKIKYCFQEDKGFRAGTARNMGAKHASGNILIFIDQDVVMMPDCIKNHVSNLKKYDCVQGYASSHISSEKVYDFKKIKQLVNENKLNYKTIKIYDELRTYFFNNKLLENVWMNFHSINFSIKKKEFLKFQFDENFIGWGAEDNELGYRLFQSKKKIGLCKECVVLHIPYENEITINGISKKKLESFLPNLLYFYKKHRDENVRIFIRNCYAMIPEIFRTEKQELDFINQIKKIETDGINIKNKERPFVSVIIPTYNNSKKLSLCITSILRQNYPKDKYEIIISDDGSSDNTKDLVKKYSEYALNKFKYPMIRYYFQKNLGYRTGQARNHGAVFAKGDYFIFLNNDIIALPTLITNYVRSLEKYDIVQGYTAGYNILKNQKVKYGEYHYNNIKKKIKEKNIKSIKIIPETRDSKFKDYEQNNSANNKDIWKVFFGTNFAIKKEVFLNENFDERFIGWGIEDHEYGYRVLKKGYSVFLDKNIIGLHLSHEVDTEFNNIKINEWINNMIRFYIKYYCCDEIEDFLLNDMMNLLENETNSKKYRQILKSELDKAKKQFSKTNIP